MEMSYRGAEFMLIDEALLPRLRELQKVPAFAPDSVFCRPPGIGRERDRADEHARHEKRRAISS